ncbi:carboxylate-amine ligase [Nocardioides aequoreus]|uniref:carboxylate-amine ligase n=1 Tax=Nocardioides aequoreus TaxID=397278 RepID=UPI0004C2E840|nr:glutamate--cysteine ligase [Nocardioides aequoreus]
MSVRQVGVEEELLLVDPATGVLTAVQQEAVRLQGEDDAPVEAELYLQQIETQTPPTASMSELAGLLRESRRAVVAAAEAAGAAAVAVATPVLVGDRPGEGVSITPQPRYLRIREEYGELATSALACAMHVHVDVESDEEGVRIIDGISPWLPLLLATSANSPYLDGRDTGHASWRSQLWARWPSQGTAEPFGDTATYDEVRGRLQEWGAALDEAMVYFDARLALEAPTVEVRVSDVCTEADDAVLLAALTRALVDTAARQPSQPWRTDLQRAATWRAARHGLADRLVDPATRTLVPARAALDSLVAHVRPALEEAGDLDLVTASLEAVLARGTGAARQRAAFEREGSLEAVVADAARRTVGGDA